MSRLSYYIPKIEDYWYEEKLLSDPLTMSYNAGYDVSYFGYHYDTGCIDFPKSRWKESYDKRINKHKFFAYLVDNSTNNYIGTINFQFNEFESRYECGIVIEAKYRHLGFASEGLKLLCDEAKKQGIKELYDNFEVDRGHVLELFLSSGFVIDKYEKWMKFGAEVQGAIVRKVL